MDITDDDFADLFERLTREAKPSVANAVRGTVAAMWKWGRRQRPKIVIRNIIEDSEINERRAKTRFLGKTEIPLVWHALDTCGLDRRLVIGLKLILLTGQRPGEIIKLEKTEIESDLSHWAQQGHKTKSKRAQVTPISAAARPLVRELIALSPHPRWLFPARERRNGLIFPHVTTKALDAKLAEYIDQLPVAKFTPHDLRRTFGTMCSFAGVPRDDKKLLLNHARKQDVTAKHYDLYDYMPEKAKALEKWGRWVMRLLDSTRKAA